jgi:putative transposase
MRKSWFTETQIVEILKEGEAGLPVAELLRKHGISRATYFQWKAKYSGATVAALKRLKELEADNSKLKRLYSELALENAALREVVQPKTVTPSAKRPVLALLVDQFRRT